MGQWVTTLGSRATQPEAYYGTYAILAGLILLSLIGLACLHALRRREHLAPESVAATLPATHHRLNSK
jgi:hypothetical protein